LQAFSGNATLAGSRPIASVYSGHQFGVWAGQLGDGRAMGLGNLNGQEIQLKGAGPTPFSRGGDGRAVLRSTVREFLCSEAMHGLGIPTTRALCMTGSPAPVWRERQETAAVLTRFAPSFIRFGHFEHFSHSGQHAELKTLADDVIARFYPECHTQSQWPGQPYLAFLARVTQRTATLLAHWQAVGFCHGVMNTDNMSILGLTLDYGPFQFLDGYNPGHICNHSDTQGRYAFANQPQMAYWNLFCLGQALLPLLEDSAQAITALESFKTLYPAAFAQRMAAKLGFAPTPNTPNAPGAPDTPTPPTALQPLIANLLGLLAREQVDYPIFWRRLSDWAVERHPLDHSVRDLFVERSAIENWLAAFASQLQTPEAQNAAQTMRAHNPQYVLRNHLAEQVIQAAEQHDFAPLQQMLQALERPFAVQADAPASFTDFPPDWAKSIAVSCSS
jgi:uncharacterized protein YdiU (UPF0061 family)